MTTDRTPYCHKIRYGITGAPILDGDDMDGSHAPGVGLAPKLIELVYSAARDGKPASVSASVTGDWTRFGQRDPDDFGGQVTTHFKNGPEGWPAWLAAEARLHDPAASAAVSSPPPDQTAVARVRALHQQYAFGDDPQDYCAHCNQISGGWIPWPCPTVQALGEPGTAAVPPPADRAAVYAEVADRLAADAEQGTKEGFTRIYRRSAAKQVREWGEELPAGPASPPPADRCAVLLEAAAALDGLTQETASADMTMPEGRWRAGLDAGVRELRRLAAEAQQGCALCGHLTCMGGKPCGVVSTERGDLPEPCPCTGAGAQQLYPATNTWTFEVCYDAEADKWHGCGPTYDSSVFDNAHETARDDFRHRAEHDRQRRKFRMVRATTTYTVEAEHQAPAVPVQPAAADTREETDHG